MKKESDYPVPVQNLRRIWNKYKDEHKITQVEAGAQLGMGQSAFSHYIANINTLSTHAILKLAAFLDVHPADIDPNYDADVPQCHMVKPVNQTARVKLQRPFRDTHSNLYVYDKSMGYKLPKGCMFLAIAPAKAEVKYADLWFVRKNAKHEWKIIESKTQPTKADGFNNVKAITHIYL